jgi:hypothetical protein
VTQVECPSCRETKHIRYTGEYSTCMGYLGRGAHNHDRNDRQAMYRCLCGRVFGVGLPYVPCPVPSCQWPAETESEPEHTKIPIIGMTD